MLNDANVAMVQTIIETNILSIAIIPLFYYSIIK